jgi:[acyl-carrier-protein] S-malonyltransferase
MIAALFPGQGSQKPGMGQDLFDNFTEAKSTFDRISKAISIDVAKLCFETDEDTLRETENAQLALYTCGVAAWSVFRGNYSASDITAAAGHSVGEYAALAAAEVLNIEDGARLVQLRGHLMGVSGRQNAGTMSAIIGMDRDVLEQVCAETEGIVVLANDNSVGQLVISGEVAAVSRAGELAKERGAKRVIPLNVSGAFHSPLVKEAALELGKALRNVQYGIPKLKVYANVTSEPVDETSQWAELLEVQLSSPVRWTESVQHIRRDGVTTFVECGVGEVLSGLVRRIDKEAISSQVKDKDSLEATMARLTGKTGA